MALLISRLPSSASHLHCRSMCLLLSCSNRCLTCAGMLLALVSVVYSALRAGSNTALFRFASGEADAADQPLLDDETGRNYIKVWRCMPVLLYEPCPNTEEAGMLCLTCGSNLVTDTGPALTSAHARAGPAGSGSDLTLWSLTLPGARKEVGCLLEP